MWLKSAVHEVHSALQKGLHLAEGIVGGIATAKGLYQVGQQAWTVGRAIAPALALL